MAVRLSALHRERNPAWSVALFNLYQGMESEDYDVFNPDTG